MSRKTWRIGQFILVLLASLPRAAGAGDTQSGAGSGLPHKIAALVRAHESECKSVVGLSAVDLRTGGTLAAIRDSEPRTPASNQKLLTSAFALARLGGGYEFVTTVCLRGKDIVVVGGYDPTLGDPVIAAAANKTIYDEVDRWVQAVRQKTGGAVAGDILLTAPVERKDYRHPDWPADQQGQWYAAPVCAVNFNDNCLDVTFKPGKSSPEPVISPVSRFVRVENNVKLGKRNAWSLRTNADDSVLTLVGTATGKTTWPLSVPIGNPPLLLGRVLAERLLQAGVTFNGNIRCIGPLEASEAGLERLAATVTPLAAVLDRAHKRSLNMAAESMFLRAGDGTWRGSAKIMAETLAKSYGLPAGSVTVSDGSGLARGNAVSPVAMTKVLAGIAGGKDAAIFVRSLPVAGMDGTLKDRMTEMKYRGRTVAKTGYILHVCALSGYALDKSGAPAVAFSILMNEVPSGKGWRAKETQDAICKAIVDWLDK